MVIIKVKTLEIKIIKLDRGLKVEHLRHKLIIAPYTQMVMDPKK